MKIDRIYAVAQDVRLEFNPEQPGKSYLFSWEKKRAGSPYSTSITSDARHIAIFVHGA
jgi:hypothetical protein